MIKKIDILLRDKISAHNLKSGGYKALELKEVNTRDNQELLDSWFADDLNVLTNKQSDTSERTMPVTGRLKAISTWEVILKRWGKDGSYNKEKMQRKNEHIGDFLLKKAREFFGEEKSKKMSPKETKINWCCKLYGNTKMGTGGNYIEVSIKNLAELSDFQLNTVILGRLHKLRQMKNNIQQQEKNK